MESSILPNPTPKKRSKDFIPRQASLPIGQVGDGKKWKSFIGYLDGGSVVISDKKIMKSLYSMGFFGKGTLSRGGPKVCYEKDDQLSPNKSETPPTSHTTEPTEMDASEEDSEKTNDTQAKTSVAEEEEKLQLTFEEAFFLSYGLGCLIVIDKDQPLDLQRLWHKFCDLRPGGFFPSMYAAYHHFRSKGWVVKNGMNYDVDFLLYKEGPCYYHSTYAVIVRPVAERNLKDLMPRDKIPQTWTALAAQTRLLNQVSKGLIYLYVIKPDIMSENKIATPYCISQFKLEEVYVRRWVPEEGREEDEESS